MDGQDNQRLPIRIAPKTPRRNSSSQRRNMEHYSFQNLGGSVTISNDYIVDVNGAPSTSYPAVLPSSVPLPLTVYGPNRSNAFAGNFQSGGYVSLPPIPYISPQATHIAIPMTHSRGPAPRIFNGSTPRIGNGNVHIGNLNATTSRIIQHTTAPPAINIATPRIMSGTPPQMRLPGPAPREQPVALPGIPAQPPPSAYIVTPDGTFVTIPSSIYTPPTLSYVAMPINSRLGTVTYSYSHTSETIFPSATQVVTNGVEITEEEEMLSVEELQITEIESSSTNDKLN